MGEEWHQSFDWHTISCNTHNHAETHIFRCMLMSSAEVALFGHRPPKAETAVRGNSQNRNGVLAAHNLHLEYPMERPAAARSLNMPF
eukprot:6179678-Pleurochrysis_carterae.AAC.1